MSSLLHTLVFASIGNNWLGFWIPLVLPWDIGRKVKGIKGTCCTLTPCSTKKLHPGMFPHLPSPPRGQKRLSHTVRSLGQKLELSVGLSRATCCQTLIQTGTWVHSHKMLLSCLDKSGLQPDTLQHWLLSLDSWPSPRTSVL